MRATAGDRIILAGELVDQPTRAGEVLEARGADGGPPYVVRWEDGHTSTMFPGPGAVLKVTESASAHREEVVARARARHPAGVVGAGHHLRAGRRHHGHGGPARRLARGADRAGHQPAQRVGSRASTHIGDEVAVARALRRLADHLLTQAEQDIEATTGEHDVTVRARQVSPRSVPGRSVLR